MSCEVDIDLIKERDKGYPKKDRKHNSWAWKFSSQVLKHRRDLQKYKRLVRCNPTSFELRQVHCCPCCGSPTNSFNYAEKIWDKVIEDAKEL